MALVWFTEGETNGVYHNNQDCGIYHTMYRDNAVFVADADIARIRPHLRLCRFCEGKSPRVRVYVSTEVLERLTVPTDI